MADEPNDPWSYGVSADDADPPWEPLDVEPEADDIARHHTGRWMSPSLGAYDPATGHEALGGGNGVGDAYFRDFGYGEGFGDGRLAAGYDGSGRPGSAADPAAVSPPPAGSAPRAMSGPAAPPPAAADRGWNGGDFADGTDPMDDVDDVAGSEVEDDRRSEGDTRRNLIEWAVVLVGAVLLALVLRALVLQAFWIPSPSMESTLLVRDRVLVNKVSYRIGDISRGDVVVFRRTDEEIAQNPELPQDVIKRVIALEGETIEIVDNDVFIDGLLLREPYLDDGVTTTDFGPETVPEGHVFVMGDNRELSLDSRFETGPVAEDRVVGRAFFLFWPLNRIGSL